MTHGLILYGSALLNRVNFPTHESGDPLGVRTLSVSQSSFRLVVAVDPRLKHTVLCALPVYRMPELNFLKKFFPGAL